jgi:hypothetical protein
LSRHVDIDDGAREFFDLWSAANADSLHRVLVLHQPFRGSADAFEPFALLKRHHENEPELSFVTALLLLTDRRWRNGSSRLVRQIADSGILDDGQLDLLARAFLAADHALYWQVPDEWFDGGADIVLVDGAGPDDAWPDDGAAGGDEDEVEPGPTVARRDVYPPLRRWAAAHHLAHAPEAWSSLLTRTRELDSRSAAAIAAGVLDRIDVLTPDAQNLIIDRAAVWPDQAVRRLGLELIASRDGVDAARRRARDDPNARIRDWAATLVDPGPTDEAGGLQPGPGRGEPPTLF